MRKIILLILFCFFLANAYAQVSNDSLAYQAQREKINNMLAQRKIKFGQYDQSLTQHTGIFGLQTKKDIRRSNDILMDIVKTDDEILQQTKILLEYRTFQQNQVQSQSKEIGDNNVGFMNTINKLRNENDQLKNEAILNDQKVERKSQLSIVIIIALLIGIILLLKDKYVKKD
jgi:hypothetical protein